MRRDATERKAQGVEANRTIPDEIRARVKADRAAGCTYRVIAEDLAADYPGQTWHYNTLRRLVNDTD